VPGRPARRLGPGVLTLVLLTAAPSQAGDAGSTRAGTPGSARPGRAATELADAIDAELLRDLDLLASPDYRRDRELTRRMPLLEQLQMLETLRGNGPPQATQAGAPAPRPTPRETK
jgi:hypothetical protein